MTFHKSIVRPDILSPSIMMKGGLFVTPTDKSSLSALSEKLKITMIVNKINRFNIIIFYNAKTIKKKLSLNLLHKKKNDKLNLPFFFYYLYP